MDAGKFKPPAHSVRVDGKATLEQVGDLLKEAEGGQLRVRDDNGCQLLYVEPHASPGQHPAKAAAARSVARAARAREVHDPQVKLALRNVFADNMRGVPVARSSTALELLERGFGRLDDKNRVLSHQDLRRSLLDVKEARSLARPLGEGGVYASARALQGDGKHAGGATGSKAFKVDDQWVQVKAHVDQSKKSLQIASYGRNISIFTEFIGGTVAGAMTRGWGSARDAKAEGPAAGPQLSPKLVLLHDREQHRTTVGSVYIEGGQGDLDTFALRGAKPPHDQLPEGMKHVRLDFTHARLEGPGTIGQATHGVVAVSGRAALDAARHIADGVRRGDTDPNAGNLVACGRADSPEGLRLARIDFGHDFLSLVNGRFSGLAPGGGIQDPSKNRILDAFNRERVMGDPRKPDSGANKLWRDYEGLIPSALMAQALRESAQSTAHAEGFRAAREQLVSLAKDLALDPSTQAQEQLKDLTESLALVCKRISPEAVVIDPKAPEKGITEALQRMEAFVDAGSEPMLYVADLFELQADIDAALLAEKVSPSGATADLESLRPQYEAFLKQHAKELPPPAFGRPAGIVWAKYSRDTPAFRGDFDAYVAHRRETIGRPTQMPPMHTSAAPTGLPPRDSKATRASQGSVAFSPKSG